MTSLLLFFFKHNHEYKSDRHLNTETLDLISKIHVPSWNETIIMMAITVTAKNPLRAIFESLMLVIFLVSKLTLAGMHSARIWLKLFLPLFLFIFICEREILLLITIQSN